MNKYRFRYSEEQITYLKQNYSNGSLEEIWKVMAKDPQTIRRKASSLGLKRSSEAIKQVKNKLWTDDKRKKYAILIKKIKRKHIDISKAIEIYKSGKGLYETARIIGCAATTLHNILIENNITIRKGDFSGNKNYFYNRTLSPDIIHKAQKTRRERRGGAYLTPTDYSRRRQSETMTRLNTERNPMKDPIIKEKARQSLKKLYNEHPEKLLNSRLRRNYMTSLERTVKTFLDGIGMKEGVDYLYNKYMMVDGGWKFPDFRIESKKLCIECDGEKWHDDLEIEAELRDNLIKRQGYVIIHLPGKEIKNGEFKCKLLKALNWSEKEKLTI